MSRAMHTALSSSLYKDLAVLLTLQDLSDRERSDVLHDDPWTNVAWLGLGDNRRREAHGAPQHSSLQRITQVTLLRYSRVSPHKVVSYFASM